MLCLRMLCLRMLCLRERHQVALNTLTMRTVADASSCPHLHALVSLYYYNGVFLVSCFQFVKSSGAFLFSYRSDLIA